MSDLAILDEAQRENPLLWVLGNVSLPCGIKWSFTGERRWMIAPFTDRSQEMVMRKAAQTGMSTLAICRVLHFAVYNPTHSMYTLPRRDDVNDFVNIYTDPIITNSPLLMSRRQIYGKSRKVDNTRIKRFYSDDGGHSSFLIFMEASVEPRMIPVDMMINDEIDRSNPNHIEIFRARLDNSAYKIRYLFSTPSIERFGIDYYFTNSTQNWWHVKCTHCNFWNRLDWEANVKVTNKGVPFVGCFRCDLELTPETICEGQWASLGAKGPGIPSGYQISSLMMPYTRPIGELYREFLTTRSVKNFYNLSLGLPYASSTGSMTEAIFKENCFTDTYAQETRASKEGRYFIGVDQGNDLYYVVGRSDGLKLKIVAAGRVPYETGQGFNFIRQLIDIFDPYAVVIDAEPNRHPVREIVEDVGPQKVLMARYDRIREPVRINRNTGIISLARTEAFDNMRDAIADGKIGFWYNGTYYDPRVLEIIQHCLNIKRDEVENRTPAGEDIIGVWKAVGPDHYAHTLLYCFVAWKYMTEGAFDISMGITEEEMVEMLAQYEEAEAQREKREETNSGETGNTAEVAGTTEVRRALRVG